MAILSLILIQLLIITLLSPSKNVIAADQIQCIKHEKTLLLELKNQLVFNSSLSTKLAKWNQSDDCCGWEGVKCDDGGRVIKLDLNYESISGGLNESSSLFRLNYLEWLDLSYNTITGPLPASIGNLVRLYSLDLSHCEFTGPIPDTLGNLTRLFFVDLSYNNLLSGSLPDSIGNLLRLSYLDLSHCKFTGHIPLALGNLTQLVFLELSYNFFSGSISSIHFQPLSKVYYMDLGSNSLSGTIPVSIFTTLPSLQMLDLSHNGFTGQVSEFPAVNVSNQLSYLDLSHNRLESPILKSVFGLQGLEALFLSDNLLNDTFQLEKILSLPYLYRLDLSDNYLSLDATSIHSSSDKILVKESPLEHLDLSNNRFVGEIPSWVWGLPLTNLNLSCNMLAGLQKPYHIPSSLDDLDLHSNQLRGELPLPPPQAWYVDYSSNYFESFAPQKGSFFSSDLEFLSFSNNSLSGPLPAFICNCTNLKVVDASGNNLSGSIPPCLFGKNFKNLEVLNLGKNNISGRIPRQFSPNCSLRTLDLNDNNLVGGIPLSLQKCTSLAVMNVGNNRIHGRFPCMLSSTLKVLVLRSNRFHGEIACQNKSWSNLQIIDIASNNFSGYLKPFKFSTWRGMMLDDDAKLAHINLGVKNSYTEEYYWDEVMLIIKGLQLKLLKIWPGFTSIDFSCNNFHGDIPRAIGDLNSLYLLNLSHNSLTGVIPKSFDKLRQLGSLDLSTNQLTGEIPQGIARLTFLQVMNVSHNKLMGKIPVSTQIQSFSADCFDGNVGLCGLPLKSNCSNPDHNSRPEQGNEETERDEIGWMYVFVAAGYAVGLGIFSWMLLFCRSFRYEYFERIEEVIDKILYQHKKKRDKRRRRGVKNQVRRQGR